MEIGQFLKKIRDDLGYSLREAAKRSGLSHSYIDAIEKGKHPKTKAPVKPSPDTLKALAKAYDYPYEELLKVAGIIEENEKTGHETMTGEETLSERDRELVQEILNLPERDKEFIIEFLKRIKNDK